MDNRDASACCSPSAPSRTAIRHARAVVWHEACFSVFVRCAVYALCCDRSLTRSRRFCHSARCVGPLVSVPSSAASVNVRSRSKQMQPSALRMMCMVFRSLLRVRAADPLPLCFSRRLSTPPSSSLLSGLLRHQLPILQHQWTGRRCANLNMSTRSKTTQGNAAKRGDENADRTSMHAAHLTPLPLLHSPSRLCFALLAFQ